MSLSSLLLGPSKTTHVAIDKGLDDLFKSNPTTSTNTLASQKPVPRILPELASTKKRKKREDPVIAPGTDPDSGFGRSPKKPKLGSLEGSDVGSNSVVRHEVRKEKKTKGDQGPVPEVVKTKAKSREKVKKDKRGKKPVLEPAVSEDEAVNPSGRDPPSPDPEEDDGEYVPPVHESLARAPRPDPTSSKRSKKYVPPHETPDQRNSRTIFVGNVPFQIISSKPLLKKFKRHILSSVPTAKIESVRFRSIAFQKPTSKLPSETDPTTSSSKPQKRPIEKDPLRQHDVDRISSWRGSKDAAAEDPEKNYLTPQEKKRVAFIKQDFHEQGDSVNAYVVFGHPPSKETVKRPDTVDVMDPYEAARVVSEKCDGTTFEGKTIRVDGVRKAGTGDVGREGFGDPKLSIFVGNLDFASKEEDLRTFFEALVVNERGARPQAQDLDDTQSSRWVTRVRIVRDKDTQLGKGFAYIQFADRECVDEILALDQENIKFAKRKLRVQRCKSITTKKKTGKETLTSPSSPRKGKFTAGGTMTNPRSSHSTPIHVPTPGSMPRGDPNLGKQLEHLSKEERKREKAANMDRVARRLMKKQVKTAMAKNSKFATDTAGKERMRVRKKGTSGTPSSRKTKTKKPRVRSEANVAKRNMKK